MLTISAIKELRKKGLTFEEIGTRFGVTKQRVFSKFTGYEHSYQKRENYKEYKRHFHHVHTSPRKHCQYCKNK